ncbi:MAG: hypothetical protein LH606_06215 [Cytophagaceae bacterium]|nr:hypothetical protein [Cytophagaceae bacterium]
MNFVDDYFTAEKTESLFFVAVGLLAVGAGAYFFFVLKQPVYRGAAIPLLLVAVLQLVVGTTVYVRSPKDIERVTGLIQKDPALAKAEELPRMDVVMKKFVLYRSVEIALLLAGLALWGFFPAGSFWRGVGLGLFVQAGLMLSLDYFAEQRGQRYTEQIGALPSLK